MSDKDRDFRITFRASGDIEESLRIAAERLTGGNVSRLINDWLKERLEQERLLPHQVDEREELIRGIESEFSVEELRELLTQRQRERTVTELQSH